MSTWRDELAEVVKSKAEREAEEKARRQKRIVEALTVAEDAVAQAVEGLKFAFEQLGSQKQKAQLNNKDGAHWLAYREYSIRVELDRSEAVLTVTFNDGRPKQFEFAKDRHLSPTDVEEYVGRRAVEMARAAQKSEPW